MALSSSSSSALVSVTTRETLQEAIRDFQTVLTDDQRQNLQNIKAVPDADAVITFTAELDRQNRNRKGRSIASRLYSVLQSVRDFSAVVDTFVSSNPGIAALVWGSVKLTMLVVVNFASYYEAISELFMSLNDHCPRFAEYQMLFPSSTRLQGALCAFHASIIRCCKHVVEVVRRPWTKQLVNALCRSFEQEFKPDTDDIRRCSTEVKEELTLTKAQADHQDQQLQSIERNEASENRRRLKNFFSRTNDKLDKLDKLDEIEAWRLQRDERQARERRQQLLDSLSTHDYLTPLKQSRRKRHSNTAQWLFQTSEFDRWINGTGSPILWCSGKIGSGKTILTASVVDYILAEKCDPAVFVSFFFPRFDDQQSLKAETIIRSIVRQALDPTNLSKEMETRLTKLERNLSSGLNEIVALLQRRIALSGTFYVIIDGLDECEKTERDDLLKALSSLVYIGSNTKLFLASRESLSGEITRTFPSHKHLSMSVPAAQSEIVIYIEDAIEEKLSCKDLIVGDQGLVEEIRLALIKGAEGMFLWVTFQIDEVCSQRCDDDIRKAIKNLPKDLTETFNRALDRINFRRNANVAQQIFPWIAAAKRPLSLDELSEAISTKISQQYSEPGQLINGISGITSWCENLLQVDEELKTVHFAHHTIRQFLIEKSSESRLDKFHFKLEEADHYIGEICVTYLNFNDFKTTLVRRPQPLPPVTPAAIAQTALGNGWKSAVSNSIIKGLGSKARADLAAADAVGALASYKRVDTRTAMEKLQLGHPFLKYASDNWIPHTSKFQEGQSRMWNLWKHMIIGGHDLTRTPWRDTQFDANDLAILNWGHKARHYAVIRLIHNCGRLSKFDRDRMIQSSAKEGDITLLNILLEGESSSGKINKVFQVAAGEGHLDIVERLLVAGAEVNAAPAENNGRTALRAAAEGGHLDVVERLLVAGAEVNAPAGYNGRTALQAAAEGGHLDVVERLLVAKAEVNAAPARYNGRTALQAAAAKGHLNVVERLLVAGAEVNAPPARYNGRTALQAAAEEGHLDVVERLLVAGAEVNASAGYNGRTALQAAAAGGHLDVVERLLVARAEVNASAGYHGRTALQAAAAGGHLDVVERLLVARAKVNAPPARYTGRTALQAAAEGGYLDVVERLLVVRAEVNAPPARYTGRTALQAAAAGGHLDVVERLLVAGAEVNASPARYNGRTALQAAAAGGHLDVVERLLVARAEVNAALAENNGRTALQAAAAGGHLDVVERLLVAGAEVNAPAGYNGRTALQAAAEGGHLDVVERLLVAGAKVNAPPTRYTGRTALQAAAAGGHLDVVERLLVAGAEVNDPPARYTGRTALQAAAAGGHLDVVERLLVAKAEVNAAFAENNGRTALQAAAAEGHLNVVERLLVAGAEVNAPPAEDNGRTALQAAATEGHLDVVERLLVAGAEVNAPPAEDNGRTALQAAAEGGHREVVSRLKLAGAR